MEKKSPVIPMNPEQVRSLLRYIDATLDEGAKAGVFTRLGHDCFACGHTAEWIDSFKGDIQKFMDGVNVDHKSPYWERLELTDNGTRLVLTGKEVDRCVCSFASDDQPIPALCTHCCRSFQEKLFSYLFRRTVKVRITASYLYGDKRCSTVVDIL